MQCTARVREEGEAQDRMVRARQGSAKRTVLHLSRLMRGPWLMCSGRGLGCRDCARYPHARHNKDQKGWKISKVFVSGGKSDKIIRAVEKMKEEVQTTGMDAKE